MDLGPGRQPRRAVAAAACGVDGLCKNPLRIPHPQSAPAAGFPTAKMSSQPPTASETANPPRRGLSPAAPSHAPQKKNAPGDALLSRISTGAARLASGPEAQINKPTTPQPISPGRASGELLRPIQASRCQEAAGCRARERSLLRRRIARFQSGVQCLPPPPRR